MQQFLLTSDEVSTLARGVSMHVDSDKIDVYIRESENIDIKPALGDALFIDLHEHPDKYELLLDGGKYEDECGDIHELVGLKSALAYYAYARLVKNGDGNMTRFGFVNKADEYSSRPDVKERVMAYNDAFSVADSYMKECLVYLSKHKDEYPLYTKNGGMKANRTIYRVIGD